MGCCLLAAIVISHWLSLWDGLRLRIQRIHTWGLRRPPRELVGGPVAPIGGRLRLGRKARLLVVVEVLVLALLGLHEFGGASHPENWLNGQVAPELRVSNAALCSAPKRLSAAN